MQKELEMKATMVLNPVISKFAGKLVVLASASPRRQEILHNVGLRFEVVPSWFKETLDKSLFSSPHEYAVETAKQKALEVARRMPVKHLKTPDIVIGADTIVTVDGIILEKPVDKHDAYRMLSRLSGKEHSVYTGVAIVLCHEKGDEEVDYQLIDFYEETRVKFADLSEDMLWEYINSGEPMDKAGGYGIQALGGMLVEYVHGDFLNVVGFPLNHFCKQLNVIYNQSLSVSGGKSESVNQMLNGSHDLSPPTHRSSSSSVPGHSDISDSPAHKIKRKGSEASESLWTLDESSSKEACLHSSEISTVVKNRGKHEDGDGPAAEDLKKICELIDGFKASKALFAACRLGLFDVLHTGLDASQVARHINASVKGTERLLEVCVSLGLLKTTKGSQLAHSCSKRAYENTGVAARFLRSDAPFSLHGYIQHCNDTLWPLYSHTENAVRVGSSQREKVKTSSEQSQDSVSDMKETKLRFMKAMHSFAQVTANAVATAFDLSGFKTACGLGGCTGTMAYEFTKVHPELSVTVFDLPAVVELSEYFRPDQKDSRVTFVAGDFLKDKLPKADLYILARILHDLTDEDLHKLLSKISNTCASGCGLLLSEIFLDEDRSGPSRGLLQALSMSEGKQRSTAEYSLLLKSHGFITAHVRHTNNLLDAMLCIKA